MIGWQWVLLGDSVSVDSAGMLGLALHATRTGEGGIAQSTHHLNPSPFRRAGYQVWQPLEAGLSCEAD